MHEPDGLSLVLGVVDGGDAAQHVEQDAERDAQRQLDRLGELGEGATRGELRLDPARIGHRLHGGQVRVARIGDYPRGRGVDIENARRAMPASL